MSFILALFISHAMASEQWLCTTQSSQTVDRQHLNVCGMGRGTNEETARMAALEDAKLEFQELCSMTNQCQNKDVSVSPGRTSCEPQGQGVWVCHRLFIYTVTDK